MTKYRIRLAVVILIVQWSFNRFHFRYRHLKVLTEFAFLTCRGREFQMAAPEYMNDLRKSSQLDHFEISLRAWLIIPWRSSIFEVVEANEVSSANKRAMLNRFWVISLTYTRNKRGPRTEPWGTPAFTCLPSEYDWATITLCSLLPK